MSKRNYERLDITNFGEHLLVSGDLDPIYIALKDMERLGYFEDERQLHRWLLAYWCLYHAGAASYISEAKGVAFWHRMHEAADNMVPAPNGARWPRGHERRHFRGNAAVVAVGKLRVMHPHDPETLVSELSACIGEYDAIPFHVISERVQRLPLFGPWISFKVGDMLDRVLDVPVNFDNAAVFMFKDPREAAFKLWRKTMGLPDTAKPKDEKAVLEGVVEHLKGVFEHYRAPPTNDRPLGLQEIETILCKWKSHMNGHYPLNNDIDEINEGLKSWKPLCRTAHDFASTMPKRISAS